MLPLTIYLTQRHLSLFQILSHASQIAEVPDEVRAKVEAYESGLLSKWTPQQTILAHPVRDYVQGSEARTDII